MKASAIPPSPMSVPPIVTLINPGLTLPALTAIIGTKKIVRPAIAWKNGSALLPLHITCPILATAIQMSPIVKTIR